MGNEFTQSAANCSKVTVQSIQTQVNRFRQANSHKGQGNDERTINNNHFAGFLFCGTDDDHKSKQFNSQNGPPPDPLQLRTHLRQSNNQYMLPYNGIRSQRIIQSNQNIEIFQRHHQFCIFAKFLNGSYYKGYINDQAFRHGQGQQKWADGTKYLGQWRHNLPYGNGILVNEVMGFTFQGRWVQDGKVEGYGKYYGRKGTYQGLWVDSQPNGYGKQTWLKDGNVYQGYYSKGQKHGQGVFIWSDGSQYKGQWVHNKIEGKGRYRCKDNRQYQGQFVNNMMHGWGTYKWPDGRKYIGRYKKDKKQGYGRYYWPDGRVFEGQWKQGKRNGYGKVIYPRNRINNAKTTRLCQSIVVENHLNTMSNSNSKVTYQAIDKAKYGIWEDDKMISTTTTIVQNQMGIGVSPQNTQKNIQEWIRENRAEYQEYLILGKNKTKRKNNILRNSHIQYRDSQDGDYVIETCGKSSVLPFKRASIFPTQNEQTQKLTYSSLRKGHSRRLSMSRTQKVNNSSNSKSRAKSISLYNSNHKKNQPKKTHFQSTSQTYRKLHLSNFRTVGSPDKRNAFKSNNYRVKKTQAVLESQKRANLPKNYKDIYFKGSTYLGGSSINIPQNGANSLKKQNNQNSKMPSCF